MNEIKNCTCYLCKHYKSGLGLHVLAAKVRRPAWHIRVDILRHGTAIRKPGRPAVTGVGR